MQVSSLNQLDSDASLIWLSGQAKWHGLILLTVDGDANVTSGSPVTLTGGGRPERSPHVTGGITTYIRGTSVSWSPDGSAGRLTGNSTSKYSRDAIAAALEAAVERNELVSYRFLD